MKPENYGVSPLLNGIDIYVKPEGLPTEINTTEEWNIKSLKDWAFRGYELSEFDTNRLSILTLDIRRRLITTIRFVYPTDYLRLELKDNFSGLLEHRFMFIGYHENAVAHQYGLTGV